MILCIQRVLKASVKIDNEIYSEIGNGLLVFVAVEKDDKDEYINWVADKISNLRIFEDDKGKMSKSVIDIGGSILLVSQFTLAANVSKGKRPDFTGAENPIRAKEMYLKLADIFKNIVGYDKMQTGVFAADMEVSLINDGPVTILMEKRN